MKKRKLMKTMVALAVAGSRNITKISGVRELCNESLESFARMVARRIPGKVYYIVECSNSATQRKKGNPLYTWHVGEGFDHCSGWWVEEEF